MATIKLQNVKKIYDNKVTAVHDFNLEIADKEFVVFVGPSGCGKSTTLRMVAGLEEISEGTVSIDDVVVNDLPPKDRNIAMVFQNYALYPHLSVFENIAFPLRLMKQEREVPIRLKEIEPLQKQMLKIEAKLERIREAKNKKEGLLEKASRIEKNITDPDDPSNKSALKEIRELKKEADKIVIKEGVEESLRNEYQSLESQIETLEQEGTKVVYGKMSNREIFQKVRDVSETLGITEYLARKPRALSGGQRQRVAIGRAMVRDSKVLLMDEPLSNLDAKLRNQMRAEIILLRKKIDSTFIYVTHDQTEAMTLGDRIVIMKDGFIQQVGTPQEVFNTPGNLFVAGFIGAPQMNFFKEAKLVAGDTVEVEGSRFKVAPENAALLAKNGFFNQDIVLGVRPEHITFSTHPGEASIKCELEVSEMMGSELHLHVVSEAGSNIVVRVPTVDLSPEEYKAATVPGSVCYISFAGKVMHLFDPETSVSMLHPENEYKVRD